MVFALFGVLLLSQVPFAYRRYELNSLRDSLTSIHARRTEHADASFREYVGVVHVHTSLGGHSTGALADVIGAARSERLDFVVMTEHTEADYDSAAQTLDAVHGGVVFLAGNETQARDRGRFLILPGGSGTRDAGDLNSTTFAAREQAAGRAVFVAYPDESGDWDAGDYDGVEIYNLFTDARRARPVALAFDSLWTIGGTPELLFARFYRRPDATLRKWDKLAARRAAIVPALGGADAHANVGAHLRLASGERLLGVQLDPYERSFRIVRQHVLLPANEPLTTATLLGALRQGNSFIAFDVFGDAHGFRFAALDAAGTEHTIGERITRGRATRLRVRTPVKSRIVLFRDGEQVAETYGDQAEFPADEIGAYRVEIYLTNLPLLDGKPWIISNHIYVAAASEHDDAPAVKKASSAGASR